MVIQHHAIPGWRIRIGGRRLPQFRHPGLSPRGSGIGRWGQFAHRFGGIPRLRSWLAPVSPHDLVHMVVDWPARVCIGESPLLSISTLLVLVGACEVFVFTLHVFRMFSVTPVWGCVESPELWQTSSM